MPAPFSQGWVENIRTLTRANWYDGISVNRVQDNYVVQWGDPNYDNPEAEGEAKALPEGLKVMEERDYLADADSLGEAAATEIEVVLDETSSEEEQIAALTAIISEMGLTPEGEMSESERIAMISIEGTQTPRAPEGWHERDSFAEWTEFFLGWPVANRQAMNWEDANGNPVPDPLLPRHKAREIGIYENVQESYFWPVHCYGMVGVGRGYSPDTGSGAELYTVIGHAPRHLDRNIALVGRIISGIEHLSSLPRGSGALGFYTEEEFGKRTPILSVRVASDLPEAEQPLFEYLSTEGKTFAKYATARANRRDPFFIHPAGGADICNIPVPIRPAAND
ncbi:peptidylprolyl isomerase [Altererythrobacter aquaemixtae]|uniref:Peptidylprolyl isomerase n=2 Tax=Pontixanthobacter aquaemixtae TaxID=1958940 RepID=A0A844ZYE1_9SPHN|nr:peptidylprolyl isomerase [Pontixanthobacter aquaemixtae]